MKTLTKIKSFASRVSRLASFFCGAASVRALLALALTAVAGATALPASAASGIYVDTSLEIKGGASETSELTELALGRKSTDDIKELLKGSPYIEITEAPPPVLVTVAPQTVDSTTCAVATNTAGRVATGDWVSLDAAPYSVWSNGLVRVTYTANAGYVFGDTLTASNVVFAATTDPAVVPAESLPVAVPAVAVAIAAPANAAVKEIWCNGQKMTGSFTAATNAQITVVYTNTVANYYFADGSQELEVTFAASANPTVGPTDGTDVNAYEAHVCDGVTFTTRITDTASLYDFLWYGGNGYLANDVTLEDSVKQQWEDISITNNLCLNGKVLDMNGKRLSVYTKLTIYDCGTTTNSFKVAEDGLWELTTADDPAAFTNLIGGVVTGGEDSGSGYPALYVNYCKKEGDGLLTIKGGNFVGNWSDAWGGVICANYGNVAIEGGVFAGNACGVSDGSSGKGGVVGSWYGSVDVTGGSFVSNTCNNAGGAFFIKDSSMTVTNATFEGNFGKWYGGVVYAEAASSALSLKIDGGTFRGNVCEYEGGVIYAYGDSPVHVAVNGGLFEGNVCRDIRYGAYGGVLYHESKNSNVAISGGTFRDNESKDGGVGYFDDQPSVTVTVGGTAALVGNRASSYGSALYIRAGDILFKDSVVISNNVGSWGTIYSYGTLTVTGDVQIVGNTATSYGSAICNIRSSDSYPGLCRLYGGTIRGNGTVAALESWVESGSGDAIIELGGSPVIAENGESASARDFKLWHNAVVRQSESFAYNPPAGQVLTVASSDANGTKNFITVVKNAAEGDLDRFVSAAAGYTLKYGDGTLYLERPYVLTYERESEGGTLSVATNGAEIASGEKVYMGEKVDVTFTPADHWQADTNTLQLVDATNGVYNVSYFSDVTLTGANFKMTEANGTLSVAFMISDDYRAELFNAATNSYLATSNAVEALRQNRLTDYEADFYLGSAAEAFEIANDALANAEKPSDGDTATNTLAGALAQYKSDAQGTSDAKPYDLVIADNFEAIADAGSYDPETGAFTVDGVAYEIGLNAFTSFRAAYAESDTAFTTNVHVYGTQLIEDDVPNLHPWTLDLHDAVLSIGIDGEKNLYASITNTLSAIKGGEGILFGKTEDDETLAVQAALEDKLPDGSEIVIKAADVTPEKKQDPSTGEEVIEARVDDTAKTEEGVTTLPQLVSDDGGNINVIVEATVTNGVLAAGKVEAQYGTVTIENRSLETLALPEAVTARDIVIVNTGRMSSSLYSPEGAISAEQVAATDNVTITNSAHLAASVSAGGRLSIYNASANTIVGTYEGASVELTGDYGSLSNVTFTSDGPVTLTGNNMLTGPFAIEASDVTNYGTLIWDLRNGNATACLADFDAIRHQSTAAFAIYADYEPALGDYVLAKNAAKAKNAVFGFYELFMSDATLVANGETYYPGDSRSYTLSVNAKNELVLTVGWGGVRFTATEVTGVIGGDPIEVEVDGGMPDRPTQVTVGLQKNTLTSFKAYLDGRKVSFPLTLNWDAGTREKKVLSIVPTKGCCGTASDRRFLTLELGGEVGQLLVAPQVCTVTVNPETSDDTLYVRALPWPANGGKVGGYGVIKTDRYGAVKTSRTLTAKANRWATFAGWYAAKADDPNTIDLENKITDAAKFKIGKGTDYTNGTFYAYFTDVLAVPAVNLPEAASEDAKGVTVDEATGAYKGTVGVKFALPVSCTGEVSSVTVSALPSGLKYNRTTGCIEGVPTRAGEKAVKIVAKNAAGRHTATFAFVIGALPAEAVGTWNGVVRELADPEDGTHAGFGTVQFSATSAGSLSAKVMTRLTGTKSFSVKGYDVIDAHTLSIEMETRGGEIFKAALSLTNDWTTAQLVGTVKDGAFAANGEEVKFLAIRNAFVRKEGNEKALDLLEAYKGDYGANLVPANGGESGTVAFRVKDGGKVYVKAKTSGKTYSATCAGAFRALSGGDGGADLLPAVQTAIRSGTWLWSTDALLGSDGAAEGFACEYDADGSDTHARVTR